MSRRRMTLAMMLLLADLCAAAPPTRPPVAPPANRAAPSTRPATTRPTSQPVALRVHIPQPYISQLYPAGGQRGQTVQMAVGGTNLADVQAVRVTGGGVSARVVANKDSEATLSVAVAADAACGERDLRVITAGGASNRFRFYVGSLPEVNEAESGDANKSQPIVSLPVVVNGQVFMADRDRFRFQAKAGQTIVCDVAARRILPYIADAVPGWCDACLTIYDASGKILLAADDDRFQPDPVLVFSVPRDGEYDVEVNDVIYRGRADFVYRLTLGQVPLVTRVSPLGGRRGNSATARLFGVNLHEPTTVMDLSGDGLLRYVSVGAGATGGNALPVAIGDWPEQDEVEPNDGLTGATTLLPPAVVNGTITRSGDADHYRFRAAAKQRLVMEVMARRLESPLDSMLTLLDDKGKELAANDDYTDPEFPLVAHHADSRLVFQFPAAGEYVLAVRDRQGKGGPEYAYRLIVRPEQPDFALRVTPDNPLVGRGGTCAVQVDALRRDGFSSDIVLAAAGLPEGFACSRAVIPAGLDQTRITLTAPTGATPGQACPRVVGTAELNGRQVIRVASPAETVMQAFAYTYYIPTREFLLNVGGPTPFTMAAGTGDAVVRVSPDNSVQLPVRIARRPGIRGGVALSAPRPAPGVQVRTPFVPADQDEILMTITVGPQVRVGTRLAVVVSGALRMGKETIAGVAPAVMLEVVSPETQPAQQKSGAQ